MFRMNPSKRGRTRAAIFAPLVFAAFTFPGAILAAPDRFVDNGDGTITDNQTGLMWEQKLADTDAQCLDPDQANRDVRCVQNTYVWSATGTAPDGTLYTDFLATLNLDATNDPNATCFANHCDWRVPNIPELQSIIDSSVVGCGTGLTCIDPTFGPTAASIYWSSTSFALNPNFAWLVTFFNGDVFNTDKNNFLHVRAVRGGR